MLNTKLKAVTHFFLASFLAWSVGFINFPPLVVLVERPIVTNTNFWKKQNFETSKDNYHI